MKRLLLALALVLPCPALAASWSGTCQFAADNLTSLQPTRFTIDAGIVGCYRFVVGDGTSSSAIFIVSAPKALICFDPDNTDAVTDTARVTVHRCVTGVGGATGDTDTCIDIGGFNTNTTLDGTAGPDSVQNACKRVAAGAYFVRVTVAGTKTAPAYSEVSIKGEN